ncbi:MAG: hypothetical protein D6722_06075, partial [Bacteroidetes bacterium]
MKSLLFFLLVSAASLLPAQPYAWRGDSLPDPAQNLEHRIPTPAGYARPEVPAGSFAEWLRALPLRPGRPQVRLHDGRLKGNQSAHHAVVAIDVGQRDLQQCADAVMRLRAEYLYGCGHWEDIHFNFTSGDRADYRRYREGYRAQIAGNSVRWVKTARPDDSYAAFRRYMDLVFSYAGTWSLEQELELIPVAELAAGDVFIKGGFPGHAVLVMDVAIHPETGEKLF